MHAGKCVAVASAAATESGWQKAAGASRRMWRGGIGLSIGLVSVKMHKHENLSTPENETYLERSNMSGQLLKELVYMTVRQKIRSNFCERFLNTRETRIPKHDILVKANVH